MKKLIICDIDNTLIEKDEIINPKIKEILKELKKYDIYFTLATGRVETLTYKFIKELEIDIPYIVSNGAKVLKRKKVLFSRTIPIKGLEILINKSINAGFSVVYTVNGIEYPLNETAWVKNKIKEGVYTSIYPLSEKDWQELFIDKLMIVDNIYEKNIGYIEEEANRLDQRYQVTKYVSRAIEIVSGGVTKHTGARFICDYLNVPMQNVISIGDHINDIELIENSNESYAVANALDIVKEKATFTLNNSFHRGVLEALESVLKQQTNCTKIFK